MGATFFQKSVDKGQPPGSTVKESWMRKRTKSEERKLRSFIMSRIRSKWTGPEKFAHAILKGNHVKHTMHPPIIGKPDMLITGTRKVVFIDGCFWHGCPTHFRRPKTNRKFWDAKIKRNMERDAEVVRELMRTGMQPVRIFECELTREELLGRIGRLP